MTKKDRFQTLVAFGIGECWRGQHHTINGNADTNWQGFDRLISTGEIDGTIDSSPKFQEHLHKLADYLADSLTPKQLDSVTELLRIAIVNTRNAPKQRKKSAQQPQTSSNVAEGNGGKKTRKKPTRKAETITQIMARKTGK